MRSSIFYILPFAFISLILGLLGGLVRMGLPIDLPSASPVSQHGVFMIGGFLGTLISLERVVVFKSKRAYIVPMFFGLGTVLFFINKPVLSYYAFLSGSVLYIIVSAIHYKKHKSEGDFFLLAGSMFQFLGHAVLYKTSSYPMALAAWLIFFLLTITGERLELTRFLPLKRSKRYELYLWIAMLVISSIFYHFGGKVVVGLSLVGVGQWLVCNDISLINIRKTGSYRFLGASLLAGFVWLIITGIISILPSTTPNIYDAFVHAFFVGFVLNMILAHAPIIFPALLKATVRPYHPGFYLGLFLLNSALIVRLIADFNSDFLVRQISGVVLAIGFLGYLISVIVMTIRGHLVQIKEKPQVVINKEVEFELI